MALAKMMIYSFEADGPSESLAFDFFLFVGSTPLGSLFDSDVEREISGVFVGHAGVKSGESGAWVPALISEFIASSRAAMPSASSDVSVAVFTFAEMHISDAGRDLSELDDIFPMMNIYVVFGAGYLGQEELCFAMFLGEKL
jgi:hypothetical protein